MANISIKLLEKIDEEELFIFECVNRTYFERMVLSRGDSYYEIEIFRKIMEELIEEQEKGLIYMYLVKNDQGELVGRVNLTAVARGNFNKAELGYRIGEKHQGKGYATSAVKLVLDEAHNRYKLHRIEAGTSPENIGSQVVLIRNAFQFTGRYKEFIYMNGKWKDSINFEKILD